MPSRAGRTAGAFALLLGFYGVTLALSLLLFAAPIADLLSAGSFRRPVAFFSWIPAVFLLRDLLFARPPRYETPRELIDRAEAPELYVLVEELAAALQTSAPTEIYLLGDMHVSLVEHDGERVLGIGAPLLATATVTELRALVARELAQFEIGSTSIVVWARAAFGAALAAKTSISSRPGPVAVFGATFSGFLARSYAKLFFFAMRASDERVVLAADRAAAAVVGKGVLEHALARSAAVARVYETYAQRDVPAALAAGGVPTDLATTLARHVARDDEQRTGAALVDIDLDAFLVSEVLERASLSRRSMRHATWEELSGVALVPSLAKRAALLSKRLAPLYPGRDTLASLFQALVEALAAGRRGALARHLQADDPRTGDEVIARTVGTLFSGALLESGANVVGWLGEPFPIFTWRGLRVTPEAPALLSLRDSEASAELLAWARELAEAPAASGIVRMSRISAAS